MSNGHLSLADIQCYHEHPFYKALFPFLSSVNHSADIYKCESNEKRTAQSA